MNQAKQLRNFHNHIKYEIIHEACNTLSNGNDGDDGDDIEVSLLDIGVGRGGDMLKWHKNNIKNVIGIDINKSYIVEAINRYQNHKLISKKNYKFYYAFENMIFQDFLKTRNIPVESEFHLISCMFALHYFWKSKDTLCNIICQISNSLKPGGFFIGTCPDGDKIHDKLLQSDNSQFKNDAILVEKKYNGSEKQIGNKINL